MERVILHSDLNNCYASIECMLHPELRGKYIAVCGSTEERHGIVLAKNQLAKQCGVKTGDVITMSAGCRHTVMAETELKLIEVQLGEAIDVHDKQKFELEY